MRDDPGTIWRKWNNANSIRKDLKKMWTNRTRSTFHRGNSQEIRTADR